MKRYFSKKQRQALALFSSGYCMQCGAVLTASFHADHVTPFSKGGATDVVNGQALCPSCNLKKGNKMDSKIILRAWQDDAQINSIKKFSSGEKFFLLQATPGGGKTICALAIAEEMKKSGIITHIVVLAPSRTLVKQWRDDAKKLFNVELSNGMIYNTMSDFYLYGGIVLTYQGMNECHENLRLFCSNNKTLVISDEMHHVADGQSWGASFRNAFSPALHILGLTGTPWASKGQSIPYVEYDEEGYSTPDFRYTKKAAIGDLVCRSTEFHPMRPKNLKFFDERTGELIGEYETIADAKEDGVPGVYAKTLQNLTHMRNMFEPAHQQLKALKKSGVYDAGGLVVAPSIEAAHRFKDEIYMLTGIEYPIVHSKEDNPHKIITEFKNSKQEWIISVDMVTEGVDIKRLQVCVFLSQKNTELFLRQVIGRIERIRNKEKPIDHTGFFYYTDTPELSELIQQLVEENKAGLALLECGDCGENPCVCECSKCSSNPCVCPCNKCGQRPCICRREEDDIRLKDLDTQLQGLIANGFHFSREIVEIAIVRKRSNAILHDVPLFVICKVVMAEMSDSQPEESQDEVPLDEKKERLRSRIQKRMIRELAKKLGRKPTGEEIKNAHMNVNRLIGSQGTSENTSIDTLESKFDYISSVDAEVWS